MTCCIVGLLILSVVARLRRAAGPGAASEVFAPAAWRPAPGQETPVAPARAAQCPPATAAVFRYAALTLAVCLAVVPALAWAGPLENTGSTGMWALRAVCYLALVGVALVLSRALPVLRGARGAGWLLVIAGAVVFEVGILDMHAFRVIEVHHGNALGDMVFHNIGPALAVAGGLWLLYGPRDRQPAASRSGR